MSPAPEDKVGDEILNRFSTDLDLVYDRDLDLDLDDDFFDDFLGNFLVLLGELNECLIGHKFIGEVTTCGGDSIGDLNFTLETSWILETITVLGDFTSRRILTGEFFRLDSWGDRDDMPVDNGSGDSLGDRIFATASTRVDGNSGDGERLDDLDFEFSSLWSLGPLISWGPFGGSLGKAMSRSPMESSRLSILIFVGLMTFLPSDSRAFAARPLCRRLRVLISR